MLHNNIVVVIWTAIFSRPLSIVMIIMHFVWQWDDGGFGSVTQGIAVAPCRV